MKKKTSLIIPFLLLACMAPKKTAIATIEAKNNSSISGKASFSEVNNRIKVEISITGAGSGPVAVHIHEFGDCEQNDGKSAGGHWNPTEEAHGSWGSDIYHSGDIGNIPIDPSGAGKLSLVDNFGRWTIGGPEETNILDKAIIIHLGNDDMVSQPSGAAGARIGCGVIKATP